LTDEKQNSRQESPLPSLPQQVTQNEIIHEKITSSTQETTEAFPSSSPNYATNEITNSKSYFLFTTPSTSIPTESLSFEDSDNIVDLDDQKEEETKLCEHVRCPEPFVPHIESLNPIKCFCNCTTKFDIICDRIRKGLNRINSSAWRCIRGLHCLEPRCEYGSHFDKQSGFCPKKESEVYYDRQIPHKFERD
jgi:hypothetical protein